MRVCSLRHVCLFLLVLAFLGQPIGRMDALAESHAIPNLWNPGERLARPDISSVARLRFLTTTDFPPFNFIDRRKRLTGFHVDLVRAICQKLDMLSRCQIQAMPWNELEGALAAGEGEAIIAGLGISAETREKYLFSRSYLLIPGRFVGRREDAPSEPLHETLFARKIAVVRGSAHAEWLAKAFPEPSIETFRTRAAALAGLRDGKVDLVFSDAVSLVFWLTSENAGDCCVLVGGPYMAEELTGSGMAIAFAPDQKDVAAAVDWALKEISDGGQFAELYLRYFPLGLY